jgi:hypothetical protein
MILMRGFMALAESSTIKHCTANQSQQVSFSIDNAVVDGGLSKNTSLVKVILG